MTSLMNLAFRGSGCVRVSFLVNGEVDQGGGGVDGVEGVLYWVGRIGAFHRASLACFTLWFASVNIKSVVL